MASTLPKQNRATLPNGEVIEYESMGGTAENPVYYKPKTISGPTKVPGMPSYEEQEAGNRGVSVDKLKAWKAAGSPGNAMDFDMTIRRYTTPLGEQDNQYADQKMEWTDSDEDALKEKRRREAQGYIDAIDSTFSEQVRQAKDQGQSNLSRQRAISARSGLGGSARGEAQTMKVQEYNNQELAAIESERLAKVQEILYGIDQRVAEEARLKREEVKGNREAYQTFLKEQATTARDQITQLSGLGVRLEDLSPEDLEDFKKYSGYDDLTLESIWNANADAKNKIDYKYEVTKNGKIIAYGIDPKTQKLTTKQYDIPGGVEAPKSELGETIESVNGTPMIIRKENGVIVSTRPLSDMGPKTDPSQDPKITDAKTMYDLANELLTADGKGGAVGAGFGKLVGFEKGIGGTDRASYEAKVEQLKNMLALPNLEKLKGAMSDKDIMFLKNIATALDTQMPEKDFDVELEKVKSKVLPILKNAGIDPTKPKAQQFDSLDSYIQANPDQFDAVNGMIQEIRSENPNATDAEIEDAVKGIIDPGKASFVSVGGDTNRATLKNAIVTQESGGNYTAVNKDSGALGKYQIMPFNLKALVGLDDTPANRQKFLGTPALQDRAFDALLAQLDKTYNGDTKKIVAAYYGGGGAANVVGTKAGDRLQGGGKYPSVNQYVDQVIKRINV